jgi:hypothetical protein
MSQNFYVYLILTATANGYPKCNYSAMNMRSSNFLQLDLLHRVYVAALISLWEIATRQSLAVE